MVLFTHDRLEDTYLWLCDKRYDRSPHHDIWYLRFDWQNQKDDLLSTLNDGSYMFSPLQRYEFDDDIVSMWSSTDMIALKMITHTLYEHMHNTLSPSCYHTKAADGSKKGLKTALCNTFEALSTHNYVLRSDIKGYYESIRFDTLINIIQKYVKNPILLQLIMKALSRIETYGGNFYEYPFKGIPKRSPLSPLLAAIALLPLDQAMDQNPHIFYARFVDDWVVLTKSKSMLRKMIIKTHAILNDLHLDMHPLKTYIGNIEKGFNFLTYFMKKGVLLPSKESLRLGYERVDVLYEITSAHHSKRSKPKRDISEYHVSEPPPNDDMMQKALFDAWHYYKMREKDQRGDEKRIQNYFMRWT